MINRTLLRIHMMTPDGKAIARTLADYDYDGPAPWVPPLNSFYRFMDHASPGQPVDHNVNSGQIKGRVTDIITMHYSARNIVIEVCVTPSEK